MQKLVGPDARLRDNNLNSLRLAMALLVVWSHCFALWYGTERDEPVSLLLDGAYNAGNVGVLAFFTISGFLISLSYQRSSGWASYLRKRVARIYPGYLVAILLCSLLVVPAFSSRAFGDVSGAEAVRLTSNLLLRGYILPSDAFGGGAVNGSLWSIPYEFWCYLGVMALGLAGLLRFRPLMPAIAAIVMLVKVWLDVTGRHPGGGLTELVIGYPYFWFTVLPPFLLGGAVLAYRDRLPRNRALLLGLLAGTIVGAHLPLPGRWHGIPANLLFPPTLAYLIFYLGFHPRWKLGDAARYGDVSYGCYLYAFPIQQMLNVGMHGEEAWRFPAYMAAAMACSLAAGVASWFLVERWFERKPLAKARRPLDEEAALAAP